MRIFESKCAAGHGKIAAGRSHHWPFGDMPPVQGLTSGEVGNVVAYVRELQRNNGIR